MEIGVILKKEPYLSRHTRAHARAYMRIHTSDATWRVYTPFHGDTLFHPRHISCHASMQ